MTNANEIKPVDPTLLDILRCPIGVHQTEGQDDPGKLELIKECWLVCEQTQMKYPIRNGIPVMLVEEGKKWKDTPVSDLPVPPPEK